MMQSVKVASSTQHEQRLISVVLDTIETIKVLFREAKNPNFTAADWAPLATVVSVNDFTWISHESKELGWREYIAYLTEWAQVINWKSTIKRIHQWQNIVYLEHEEHFTFGDTIDSSCSLSVYEFNDLDKIKRLAIYLQHKPSLGL